MFFRGYDINSTPLRQDLQVNSIFKIYYVGPILTDHPPARSIGIFAACLALSMKCEIVIFSPARRASRKLLERIVE